MHKERAKSPSLWTKHLYVAILAFFKHLYAADQKSEVWTFVPEQGKRSWTFLHSHWSSPSNYGLHLSLGYPASYPHPHSTDPSRISRATATPAESLERCVDSQTTLQTRPAVLLWLVPQEWILACGMPSPCQLLWLAVGLSGLLLPAAPASQNSQLLGYGALTLSSFHTSAESSPKRRACQGTGDNLKMQDWPWESIQIPAAGTVPQKWKHHTDWSSPEGSSFRLVEWEGPGLTPDLHFHTSWP